MVLLPWKGCLQGLFDVPWVTSRRCPTLQSRTQKYEKASGGTKKMCKNFFIREYFTNFAIKKIINTNEALWK